MTSCQSCKQTQRSPHNTVRRHCGEWRRTEPGSHKAQPLRRPGRGPIPSFPSFATSLRSSCPRSALHVPQAGQGGLIALSTPANKQTPTQTNQFKTIQCIFLSNMSLGNICRLFLDWKLPLLELDSGSVTGQWPRQ